MNKINHQPTPPAQASLKTTNNRQDFWQRMEGTTTMQTEDSLVFRILVQALVIVGIIATDVAAETQNSFWAIPLSIAGASWSWHRRKYRNITTKFLLAIGMLGALFLFLGNLMQNLNDSRLVLSELLIQLQVLHSFDIPRRKDLGYSMVIGLILLGVAGTVSQTMMFAPLLLLFLAIAIPTLVLDYRSRLGLEEIDNIFSRRAGEKSEKWLRPSLLNYSPLSPSRLALFLGITLGLGLAIFISLPRFSGYQLQSFPVSSPNNSENQQLDDQNPNIINPGYLKGGKLQGKGGTGSAQSPTQGPGEMDSNFYYGFNRKINQNLRGLGRMKPEVVLRVRSQAPGFWKVLSFDRYTGQGWEITHNKKLTKLERSSWSYRFDIPVPLTRAITKEVIQSYTAVSALPNVVPALAAPKSLYFPAKEIGMDRQGSLRSPLGLLEGLTYTVISEVPYRDRTTLGQLPADYPQDIKAQYLQVPPQIVDKVRQKALELLSRSPKPITSVYEATLFLTQSLKQNYSLREDLPFFAEDQDLVTAFLFDYQGGYPDHFSTVLTVMLRSIGIPARLTVGFGTGRFNPFTGYYEVRNTDAYALTEVYFPYFGWYSFDPLPGHDLIPSSIEEEQTFGVLEQFWKWIAGWVPSPIAGFFGFLWEKILGSFLGLLASLWRFISQIFGNVLSGLIFLVGGVFLGWLGWDKLSLLLYRRRLAKLPPMARLYQQMLAALKAKGYPKNPAKTPLEYVQDFRQNHPSEIAEIIEKISQAYVGWRYGEQGQNIDYLQQQLKLLIKRLKRFNSNQ